MQMLNRIAAGFFAVAASACASAGVTPETPTLVSISGHGTPTILAPNSGVFRFDAVAQSAVTGAWITPSGSTVVFTVPYPTSIEAFIDNKPLTKVQPPKTNRYQYTASISNPGSTPAKWNMDVQTPYDVPLAGSAQQPGYTLTIYDVSGSQRSTPLIIQYVIPLPVLPPPPADPMNMGDEGAPGVCPNGAQEKEYIFCWKHPGSSPYSAGTVACSESEAVSRLMNSFPGYSYTSGACP
jgi:hypothetical protein